MLGCKQIQQKRRPIALHSLATRRDNLAFDGCGNSGERRNSVPEN
jgi:hypothetical protein